MHKSLTIILTLLILNSSAFGQNVVGLKFNLGVSKVTAKNNWRTGQQKFPIMPSGQCGLFYNKGIGNKSILGVEMLFVQIEGKEKYQHPYGSTEVKYRNYSFVGLPVYYGYIINKITINAGFQFNYLVLGRERERGKGIDLQGKPYTWEINGILPHIDKYDYGIKGGIIFNTDRKCEIEATYYHGLNNIWRSDRAHQGVWKVKQLTVGVRYKFLVRE